MLIRLTPFQIHYALNTKLVVVGRCSCDPEEEQIVYVTLSNEIGNLQFNYIKPSGVFTSVTNALRRCLRSHYWLCSWFHMAGETCVTTSAKQRILVLAVVIVWQARVSWPDDIIIWPLKDHLSSCELLKAFVTFQSSKMGFFIHLKCVFTYSVYIYRHTLFCCMHNSL